MNLAQWALAQITTKGAPRDEPPDEIELVVESVKSREPDESDLSAILGRLADLGVASGETIRYFGRAPLGEPIFICVRETVIALRLSEAEMIFVGRK